MTKPCQFCAAVHAIHIARYSGGIPVVTHCGVKILNLKPCQYALSTTLTPRTCDGCRMAGRALREKNESPVHHPSFEYAATDDVCANHHGGVAESKAAFHSTAPASRESLKNQIIEFIKVRGEASCEVVELSLSLSHQTASARLSELLREGRVVISPDRGVTKAGRACRIYQVEEP